MAGRGGGDDGDVWAFGSPFGQFGNSVFFGGSDGSGAGSGDSIGLVFGKVKCSGWGGSEL